MKLNIAELQCDSLRLDDGMSPPTVLEFQNISQGTGDLEFTDGLSLIREVVIRKVLANLELPLSGGSLRSEQPIQIEHVSCSGRIRNGFVGELRSSIAESERLCFTLESVTARAHVVAEGLHLKLDGRGGLVEIDTLTLSDAQCVVGAMLVRVASLTMLGLRLGWEEGEHLRLSARKASARDVQLQLGATSIQVDGVELSEGIHIGDSVEIENISVATLQLTMEELRASPAQEQEPQGSPTDRRSSAAPSIVNSSRIALDRDIFDTANGKFSVDTTISMTLPVIGKRVATHHFRVGIDGGIINYRELERGLSNLEDAFLDLRVRDGQLVLDRDIPLIPGLAKAIVRWDLGPGEVELAMQHLVRIRTLLRPQIVSDNEEDADKTKKSRVQLHRLDFDKINLSLCLDETAVLRSEPGSLRAHADALCATGQIHYDPDPDEDVLPTVLAINGKGLGCVAETLQVMGHNLSAAMVIGQVEGCELCFDELAPKSLQAQLKNITVSSLHVALGEESTSHSML